MMGMEIEIKMSPTLGILTENEINNLIYSLIKFSFRKIRGNLNNPPNKIIKEIMFGVVEDPTIDNIINGTLATIIDEYRISFSKTQRESIHRHMELISRLFMNEPFELRSDLGEDEDSDDFITKH